MSTVPIILAHERPGGPLCRFLPRFRGGEGERRMLSVDSGLHRWLFDLNPPPSLATRAAIRAHLGEFVRGDPVDDLDFMKRVEDRRVATPSFSHGVWAISPRFKPQFRFFGLFAIADWFVALNRQNRDLLQTDSDWHAEIDKVLRSWAALFPGRDPWVRDHLREYIRSNAEKCDDRW